MLCHDSPLVRSCVAVSPPSVRTAGKRLLGSLIIVTTTVQLLAGAANAKPPDGQKFVRDPHGAIIRGDVTAKKLSLVFTGDKHGESAAPILDALKDRKIKAGLFVTGNFVRDPKLQPLLRRAISESHYLGPHSDSHPLYSPWDDREKSLVTQEFFVRDLEKNIAALRSIGALRGSAPLLFIPPYEWHNVEHTLWAEGQGVTLINFTPGSGSNRDYAPEGDERFVSSRKIFDDILAYEKKDPHGLNGFVLLLHLGSGRKDPFHKQLGPLCDELRNRGYEFVRIDKLLPATPRRPL